jgi:hypothetical protein
MVSIREVLRQPTEFVADSYGIDTTAEVVSQRRVGSRFLFCYQVA